MHLEATELVQQRYFFSNLKISCIQKQISLLSSLKLAFSSREELVSSIRLCLMLGIGFWQEACRYEEATCKKHIFYLKNQQNYYSFLQM